MPMEYTIFSFVVLKLVSDDSTVWNIDNPLIVGISCPPDQLTHINCLKAIGNKLWIAAGELIYVMDPLQLGIEVCKADNRVRNLLHCHTFPYGGEEKQLPFEFSMAKFGKLLFGVCSTSYLNSS